MIAPVSTSSTLKVIFSEERLDDRTSSKTLNLFLAWSPLQLVTMEIVVESISKFRIPEELCGRPAIKRCVGPEVELRVNLLDANVDTILHQLAVSLRFHQSDLARRRPSAVSIVLGKKRDGCKQIFVSFQKGSSNSLKLLGRSQSPAGSFALISTFPYLKANEPVVRMRALRIGLTTRGGEPLRSQPWYDGFVQLLNAFNNYKRNDISGFP